MLKMLFSVGVQVQAWHVELLFRFMNLLVGNFLIEPFNFSENLLSCFPMKKKFMLLLQKQVKTFNEHFRYCNVICLLMDNVWNHLIEMLFFKYTIFLYKQFVYKQLNSI